ncbi:MAG: hypothetical protein EHM60_03520 [Lysobacterales bacterium]|nr:MAG: hypothetical protein EHM60_03520 [Xanthomonadales bacterium]
MVLLAGCAFAGATLLQAQEGPSPVPAAEPTQPAATPATESEPAAAAESAPSPEASERPAGSTPSRFEPTEKVRADFDVSFPIDI